MPLNQTTVQVPASTASLLPGTTITQYADHTGSSLVSELHGKWYNAARQGNVWHANVTGVTLPVIAGTLASKFSLYNPLGTAKNLELISIDLGALSTATVVNVIGLYYESGVSINPTSITYGTAVNGLVGTTTTPIGKFCTALTHTASVTPTRLSLLSTWTAVTSTADSPIHYDFDGKIIVPPGCILSVAASTGAWTASSFDVGISWAEWPL